MTSVEILHFHLFAGLGGGAKGFNQAKPRAGQLQGNFRCLGGIDVDPGAMHDFEQLTGTKGTVLDLFDREQYVTFHGCNPPQGWKEATAADIQRAAGGERPHIVFLSAPCKGFSGLLAAGKSKTDKYQALNRLTLRGVWLMLEAWRDDPPELVIFENVPRIATRGRHLLDQIGDLLRAYGYAVAETTHDCGELGGLAESRKRFLLVARHMEKVQPFLYQPDTKPLRAVGDVLGRMPMPGAELAGPMHRMPRLAWKTWVRLAFVEAGSDWRSLNKLVVENGHLRDYLIVPSQHPTLGVPDPRFEQSAKWKDGQALGVRMWSEHTGAIAGQQGPLQGAYSVADPRHAGPAKHSNEFRIVPWDDSACAVTSAHGSGQCVADPRREGPSFGKYAVTPFGSPTGTVISGSTTGQGAFAVADPRSGLSRAKGDHYLTAGHYGVVPWTGPAGAVSASAGHDNGRWSVADPRMPSLTDKLDAVIWSLDGTRHRPFTTLELAALQSLIDPEDTWVPWRLQGENDQEWRERIGNAVPSAAAEAIAEVMGETLLLAWSGETFSLSAKPVWVRPVAAALSVATQEQG
ncbi:DNA cytosine methyltransferase [Limnohabitans radicicola]|uniref:DNA cytosine methyltransferase n=1 Tax=Limnohabitans radicicola TaxID=2771427 RepID=A0A927FKD4_9BURK|nr:DNA cytosine methyltransferase [Limnohabitans radicicola]MBD8051130.1 DNA cytosine methyltransferase [Limnohabitans radicicola]